MSKEWELIKHETSARIHYEWILQGQDMDYSLAVVPWHVASNGVWFELDTTLTDPIVTRALVRQGLIDSGALTRVLKGEPCSYICWVGDYPKDVEELCQRAGWSLPPQYKEVWSEAVAIEKSRIHGKF